MEEERAGEKKKNIDERVEERKEKEGKRGCGTIRWKNVIERS